MLFSNRWALPNQMAQAGFYHQPSASGDDRAMCFTCNVCLVCWEKTDEPWGEHERHSPSCPFVKGEYTQNVPLAVTYATEPATQIGAGFDIVSTGTETDIVASANSVSGEIQLWKVKRQLHRVGNLQIRDDACQIVSTLNSANISECDLRVTALCTYRSLEASSAKEKGNCKGLKLVCGVISSQKLYLVVYTVRKASELQGSTTLQATTNQPAGQQQQGVNDDQFMNKALFDSMAIQNGDDNGSLTQEPSTMSDGTIEKKSSLKNITTDEENFEEDCPTIVGNKESVIGYDTWKVTPANNETTSNGPASETAASAPYDPFMEWDFASLGYGPTEKDLSEKVVKNIIASNSSSVSTSSSASSVANTPNYSTASGIDPGDVTTKFWKSIMMMPIIEGDYYISEIVPSFDQKFLLVVLRRSVALGRHDEIHSATSLTHKNAMDIDEEPSSIAINDDEPKTCAQIIVYQINDNGSICENPLNSRLLFDDHCPQQICMLPSNTQSTDTGSVTSTEANNATAASSGVDPDGGVFAMVCADGSLQLVAMMSLRTVANASSSRGHKFVSIAYCRNLERLCACTSNGVLHFYSFYDVDVESDEQDDDNIVFESSAPEESVDISEPDGESFKISHTADHGNMSSNPVSPPRKQQHEATGAGVSSVDIIAHKEQLGLEDLKPLYSLTLFDEMQTPYLAEVPGCWTELAVSPKSRRHHVRPSDDSYLTKTWRLHNDALVKQFDF